MKPFKGVISDWRRDGDVVVGTCAYHPEAQAKITIEAAMNNRLVIGCPMHTSRVEKIEDRGAYQICETKNSVYVLTQPRL